MVVERVREFLRLESAAGIVLMFAAALALLLSNSPAAELYARTLDLRVALTVDGKGIDKPLLLWINDGLMALFFLLVGLEIKREVLEGELSSPAQIALPAIGAAGGFAVPALVYAWFNRHDAQTLAGWAIPAATDIAFALGVLALLGKRVPLSLKLFLTSLAIFDDLAAVIVIALFYTSSLSTLALAGAAACISILVTLNRRGVRRLFPYMLTGLVLWVFVLKSGVHATLAGVVVALTVPLREDAAGESPLRWLEHLLHPWIAFGVLPVFALANAGVPLGDTAAAELLGPVPLGIALGLFLGKQCGVFVACWAAIRLRVAALPAGASWPMFHAVCVLTGIGFTMSLFIGNLAFGEGGFDHLATTRVGVLVGSVASALAGLAVFHAVAPRVPSAAD
jgi:NhaA family Na+:H+ antiporter